MLHSGKQEASMEIDLLSYKEDFKRLVSLRWNDLFTYLVRVFLLQNFKSYSQVESTFT